MDRRKFLARAAIPTSVGVGLAGCLGTGAGPAAGTGTGTASGEMDAPTDSMQTGDRASATDHAAMDAVDEQPFLGPEPGAARGTIVAFEDPSCPRCAAFERETVPKIRSELVEPGDATFVFRGYPVVYPWGEPAAKALEATFARDEDAHWSLLDYYLQYQDQFSADGVLDATADFLAGETSVDGTAVATAVRDGAYDGQVRTDLDAGEAAGVGGVTPTVFLFRDGEFRTKARGSVSYSVVESALGI